MLEIEKVNITDAPARNADYAESQLVLLLSNLPESIQKRVQKTVLTLIGLVFVGGITLSEYRPNKEMDIAALMSREIMSLTPDEISGLLASFGMTLADFESMFDVHEFDVLHPVSLNQRLSQRKIETFEQLVQTEIFRWRHVWEKHPVQTLPQSPREESVPSAIRLTAETKKFPNGKERMVLVQIVGVGIEKWLDPQTLEPIAVPVYE